MDLGVPELLIIAFIVVLLFGSKKLPGAARSIGQSLKIFKDETKGLRDESDEANSPSAQQPPAPALPPSAPSSSPTEAETPRTTPHV
jgi:sec-independent protein translocase protein TatA